MTARQLCNALYFFAAEGRDEDGMVELEEALNPTGAEAQDRRRALVYMLGGEVG